MWLLTILSVSILLIISYQDFTSRLISWYYFPIVAILLLLKSLQGEQYYNLLENIVMNFLVIVFLLLMTTILVSIKNGKITYILDSSIGSADILAFGLISIALSPINLVLFLLLSFLSAAIYQLIALPFSKKAKFIPLAGIVGVLLSIVIVLQDGLNLIDLTSDFKTLGFIGGFYSYW